MSLIKYPSTMPTHDETHPDPRPGFYYVTAIDADRVAYLMGPYESHAEALANVEKGKSYAYGRDPRSWFYAYGTARSPKDLGLGVFGK